MLPYITEWESDHCLVKLIGYQCSGFGSMPPVYRRPSNYNHQQQSQQPPPQQQQFIAQQPQQRPYHPHYQNSSYNDQNYAYEQAQAQVSSGTAAGYGSSYGQVCS
jgi:hypothetical protein